MTNDQRKSGDRGYEPVEILHIDTERSRDLYAHVSPAEKARAEKFLKDFFASAANSHKGRLHGWNGDGGFALFRSKRAKEIGNSVRAAKFVLEKLASLNAQTARALGVERFSRNIRLAAHRGEVFLARDKDVDSAAPEAFDNFLKYEKRFAPHCNEFFITDTLFSVLEQAERSGFERFKKSITAGSLRTSLHRLRRVAVPKAEDIFRRGDDVNTITQDDWKYLREQISSHFINLAARNQITKGLIATLARKPRKGRALISSEQLVELTLDALISYLREVFPDHRIRMSYWRVIRERGEITLKMLHYRYPDGESTDPARRAISAKDIRFKVAEAFQKKELVITPSVFAARLEGRWHDFDQKQMKATRSLASALQIPVYWTNADDTKNVRAVLSLDADKPDFFMQDERALWRDALVGFLVNLALAERMHVWGA